MPTAHLSDINVYYEIRGDGPPLLIIPGLANDISELERVIGPLSEHAQVIAFDNRGAGRSDKPDIPYSIEMMAEDAAALMDVLGVAHADVFGISMGGRIALELALRHPAKVDRLILVGTSCTRRGRIKVSWAMSVVMPVRRLPVFRGAYPQPRYAFKRQRTASLGFDCAERLWQLDVPTLILHGTKDKTAPFADARALHARIAHSTLVPFRGGHLFFLLGERPRFLAEIATFLHRER